jgi:putative two-component system response regulator
MHRNWAIAGSEKRVLLVDTDTQMLRWYDAAIRREGLGVYVDRATSTIDAWDLLVTERIHVVVCNEEMPRTSGLELLERIATTDRTRDVAVVMVTSSSDPQDWQRFNELGAVDYVRKPLDPVEFCHRLSNALVMQHYRSELSVQNLRLKRLVEQRTAELTDSQVEILLRLAIAAEYRDETTGNHVLRVGHFSRIIARTLGLEKDLVDTLFLAAQLHDIGKIGIPDAILLKEGRLNEDEWRFMKRHCEIGAAILTGDTRMVTTCNKVDELARQRANSFVDSPVLNMGAVIALSHHERWDGKGYPYGLQGERIPLEARIVSISDVYDALRSDRPYKKGFSVDHALEIIGDGSGKQFDPVVHSAFLLALDEVYAIESALCDSDSASPERSVATAAALT